MRSVIDKYLLSLCVLVALVGGLCRKRVEDEVTVEKATDTYGFLDGPHWDRRTQKLYFVDMYNQYIRRLDPTTGVVTSAYIKNGTVGVVVTVDGSVDQLVAGVGKDVVRVTWDGESNESEVPVETLCSLDSPQAQTQIHDGKVDSSGRFWLGTMANEVNGQVAANQGTLYRIDDNLKPKKEISPVSISNGLTWNKEDDTFYYIDSPRQIVAYDYSPNSGKISNKRIVFDLNKDKTLKGVLDGMTIDTDDNLWIALFGGHHVIKVDSKTGTLLYKVKVPAKYVTSVIFGDPLLKTLYVTTSGYNLTAEQRKRTPQAGAVFAVKGLGVRGIRPNSFMIKK